MKRAILLLTSTLLLQGCLSTIKLFERDGKLMGVLPLINGKVVYRETVQTPELPKEEVFRRARRWWVDNYRSAKDVFQLVDRETGEIVGKGYGTVYANTGFSVQPNSIFHVISFDVSEDSYTVNVYGMAVENAYSIQTLKTNSQIPIERYNIGTVKSVTALFTAIDEETRLTIKSLNDYIKRPFGLSTGR